MSSARVVRCWVKSRNERNPCCQLPALSLGTLARLPVTSRRKAGMTSNHHAPYDLGYTRATMDRAEGSEAARWSETHKTVLSSDCSLQLDCKNEDGIASNRESACRGEYVLGPCEHTARHTT